MSFPLSVNRQYDRRAIPSAGWTIHPASMAHVSTHHPTLLEMLQAPTNSEILLQYVVYVVRESLHPLAAIPKERLGYYVNYLGHIVDRAALDMATILVSMYYISQCNPLQFDSVWPRSSRQAERIILGALISATKFINENSYKLPHWAELSGFEKADVAHIERVFLASMDYNLAVPEDKLLLHRYGILGYPGCPPHDHKPIPTPTAPQPPPSSCPLIPLLVASESIDSSSNSPITPVAYPAADDMDIDKWCNDVKVKIEIESPCLYGYVPSDWTSVRAESPRDPALEDDMQYIEEDIQYIEEDLQYPDDDDDHGEVHEPLGAGYRLERAAPPYNYADRYYTLALATPPDSSRLPPIRTDWNPAPFSQTLPHFGEIFSSPDLRAPLW